MALNINGTTGISGVDGSASAPALTGTDSNTGVSFGSDILGFNTGGVERSRFDSNGQFLVGTTASSAYGNRNMAVGDASDSNAFLEIRTSNSGTGHLLFSQTAAASAGNYQGYIAYNQSSNHMSFHTNGGTEAIRIDSTGGLRVGTTSHIFNTAVNEQASIKQTDNGAALTLQATNITGGYPILWLYSSDTTAFQNAITFQRTTGSVGTITTSASSTAYNTSSDYRLKENVIAISDGITRLKTLKPSRFNFKVDKDTTVDGFLAHEVTAVPEAITGTKDETEDILYTEEDTIPSGKKVGDVKETVPKYQGIDQSKLVPLLTAALQEAVAKIEVLETKVAALEAG